MIRVDNITGKAAHRMPGAARYLAHSAHKALFQGTHTNATLQGGRSMSDRH